VVEEHAVAGENAIGLAVIHGDPKSVQLGDRVRRPRVEGRRDALRHLLHLAVELRRGGLVELGLLLEATDADGVQQAQRADAVDIGCVLWAFERHSDMALGTEVVDLVRLHELNDAHEAGAVAQITVMQHQPLTELRLLIELINPLGVELRAAALDAMHLVAFREQKLT
jgi:hypothetical protein